MCRQFRQRVQHQFRHRGRACRAAEAPGQTLVIQADAEVFHRLVPAAPGADTDEDLLRFRPAAEGIGLDLPAGRGNVRLLWREPCAEGAEKVVQGHGGSDSDGK